MNQETYNDTQKAAGERLSDLTEALPADFNRRMRRELASETVRAEMAEMEAAGRILKLTDEEIRLLRSFRQFKATAKKTGVIFKWQTTPLPADILVVSSNESIHVTDPQDISEAEK